MRPPASGPAAGPCLGLSTRDRPAPSRARSCRCRGGSSLRPCPSAARAWRDCHAPRGCGPSFRRRALPSFAARSLRPGTAPSAARRSKTSPGPPGPSSSCRPDGLRTINTFRLSGVKATSRPRKSGTNRSSQVFKFRSSPSQLPQAASHFPSGEKAAALGETHAAASRAQRPPLAHEPERVRVVGRHAGDQERAVRAERVLSPSSDSAAQPWTAAAPRPTQRAARRHAKTRQRESDLPRRRRRFMCLPVAGVLVSSAVLRHYNDLAATFVLVIAGKWFRHVKFTAILLELSKTARRVVSRTSEDPPIGDDYGGSS